MTIHVYGSWLRGDPRGWRSRHHREHVIGHYKNPPPKGQYDAIFAKSKKLMKRPPVKIAADLRQFIADAFAEKLLNDKIETLIISVYAKHVHILARFPDHNPCYWIGWAKKYVTQIVKAHGPAVGLNLERGDGLWAKRSHPEPITHRAHQLHTFGYILAHAKNGAKIWRFGKAPEPENVHG